MLIWMYRHVTPAAVESNKMCSSPGKQKQIAVLSRLCYIFLTDCTIRAQECASL